MRRLILAAIGLALVALFLTQAPASAQYVTPPGGGPDAGATDTGVISTEDTPGQPPASVLGQQFDRPQGPDEREIVRGASSSSDSFGLTWAWFLLALALGIFFLIFWRRRRDEEEEEDDWGGAQPAT